MDSAAVEAQLAPYLVQPSKLPAWPSLTEAPPKGKNIYYVSTGSGTAAIIGSAIKAACDALGWTYHPLTFNGSNPASANSALLTAVGSGADGVIMTGRPKASIMSGLDAAKTKGVEIVQTQGTDSPGTPGFDQVGNTPSNAAQTAKVIALGIVADAATAGATAHVGVVTTSGIPAIQGYSDATLAAIKGVCPSCSADSIDVPVADLLSGQAAKSVVSFIQRHPETNYVHVVAGAVEGGLRQALDAAGLTKVEITGYAPTPAQNQAVKDGKDLFYVQSPSGYYGWIAIDTIARHLTGGNASIHNAEADPVWLVNKTNLEFDPNVLPDFPAGYQEQLKKLWGPAS
ncbi:sugar ABC transporter substrate-binding protein [Kribbella kalugense]|uniref:ABC-type sugar transport system substrate-binding protein n=1 Tax=Kribbella kalugense TaxID=2512221 RepID=A0A4V3G8U4_9ACTN|nr:substrate-binding domain-containing protein [Kribbella kalugense]TDW24214.1 ABC-type sugar transport system substrate-binding protein [Kribbella kalugense]